MNGFEGRFNKFDDSTQNGKSKKDGDNQINGKDTTNQTENSSSGLVSKDPAVPKKKNPYEVTLNDFITLKVSKTNKRNVLGGYNQGQQDKQGEGIRR